MQHGESQFIRVPTLLATLDEKNIKRGQVDYIILTHIHLDGRSIGPNSINGLVTPIPLSDPVNTVLGWEIKHGTIYEEEISNIIIQNEPDKTRNLAYVVNDQLHDIRNAINTYFT
jgi:hypothetical protein